MAARKRSKPPRVVKGMDAVALSRAEFARRFRARFYDPGFEERESEIDALVAVAWDAYHEYRKSPRTRRAGAGFADPDFELAVRLVCADGGNPDPTSTGGKDPARAKALELAGWDYPKHLAGRAYAVVVHGDAAGTEPLRRGLCDWLSDLGLVPAGPHAGLDRYLGYFQPYATSHDDLDRDVEFQQEVVNRALALCATVRELRRGRCPSPERGLEDPRKK